MLNEGVGTGTRLIGGLIALVFVAALIGFIFTQFTEINKAVQGYCIVKGTAASGGPPIDTTWAVGQSWQVGGPWTTTTVPGSPTVCSATGSITQPTGGGAVFSFVPSAVSHTPLSGIMSLIVNLGPLSLLALILFVTVMGAFGWKDKIFGGGDKNTGNPKLPI